MEHDAEETVIRPLRARAVEVDVENDDTILTTRRAAAEASAASPTASEGGGAPTASEGKGATGQPAAHTPSPMLYRFAVNRHAPIELDRPAHIGRRPSLPRVPQRMRPRLVRVPSPLQEVSGTHLEVRQEGASVVITDLRSTNGTIVTAPGGTPRGLRPGESLVVTPGTLIDIGDGNLIEILALHRPTTSSSEGAPQ